MVFKKQQRPTLSEQHVINIRNLYFINLHSYEQIMQHLKQTEHLIVSKSLLQKVIHARKPYDVITDDIDPHIKEKRKPKRETYPLYLKSRSSQYYRPKQNKPITPSLDSMHIHIKSLQEGEEISVTYQDAQEIFNQLNQLNLEYTWASAFPNLKIKLKNVNKKC